MTCNVVMGTLMGAYSLTHCHLDGGTW